MPADDQPCTSASVLPPTKPTKQQPQPNAATQRKPSPKRLSPPKDASATAAGKSSAEDDIFEQLKNAQRLIDQAMEKARNARRPTIDDLTIGQLRAIVADANVEPLHTRRIDEYNARIAAENAARQNAERAARANAAQAALPFPTPGWCWYHQKYGHQARQCRPPCT